MVRLRVLIVCLILHNCGAKEYCIIPSVDTQCCSRPCSTLESFNTSDAVIQLILQPGNHSLSSKLEILNKERFILRSLIGTSIACDVHGQLFLEDINHVEMTNITFLGCENITATNVTTLEIKNCSYFNDYIGSVTLLHLTSTKATIKMCSFYKTAIITGTAEVSTILSNNSNVTYKAKKQTVITIINCTFHSTNLMQELEHNTHLALINIFNGNFTMEGSRIENDVGERIIFIR